MSQTLLPFELDQRAESGALTAHGGVLLLIEVFRTSGVAAMLAAGVVIKRRKRVWRRPWWWKGRSRYGRRAAGVARV